MTTQITDFEVVDHGVENSSYFQGCGTAFTAFEHVATGIGDTFHEAVDDALESIAQHCKGDYEHIEALIMADNQTNTVSVSATYPDAEDTYYHVSIRYNTEDVSAGGAN